jgi:hypothetical protein
MNTPSLLTVIAAASIAIFGSAVEAKTLTIAVDLSGSNPLLTHEHFAAEAARRAVAAVQSLNDGDVVRLRTFGAREDARNVLNQSVTIGRRMRSTRVAEGIGAYLRSLPKSGETGQASTNLLAWLEFESDLGCSSGGEILVITDAVESSSLVSAKALLEGKAKLPPPSVDLSGCQLTFFGLGAGWPAPQVKRLRDEWTRWATKAGAKFTVVIP